MQCLAVDVLPEGPEWVYEFKLDGYRAMGRRSGGIGRLISRNARDLSARFPDVTAALRGLPDETVVDGEVVAIEAAGRRRLTICRTIRLPALRFFTTYSTC